MESRVLFPSNLVRKDSIRQDENFELTPSLAKSHYSKFPESG